MPGIVGMITRKARPWAEEQLHHMVEAQRHESFYVTGTFIDEGLGVYAGWTALQGSFSDTMPVSNELGNISLIFSGEEYSAPGTISNLKQRGHVFDPVGPSYLTHIYEEEASFPEALNGMFHGVVVDRVRGSVILFNDRYGMHRIYYHESHGTFYFAAEAKAIVAVRPELRSVDLRGLGEFVACGCVLENRTIFKGVQVLPGASAWTFQQSAIPERKTYFHVREWEDQDPLEPEPYQQELQRVLLETIPRYLGGPHSLGIALTGGLDTRVLMAGAQPAPGTLQSYTFGGMLRESQDARVARRVAEECQQPYQVISAGEEFLSKFPHYAQRSMYLAEGGADVYRASDLYLSEKARTIAPAKIVGTYGSEIIRHAVMFKPTKTAPEGLSSELLPYVTQARDTYQSIVQVHPTTLAAFRQAPWYHHGILALEQTQLTVRSPFLDNEVVRTVYRAPRGRVENGDVRLRLIGSMSPALARIPSDRGVVGRRNFTSDISRWFLEFLFKAEYAYDAGMPQWLARLDRSLSALRLERIFLGRHKFLHFRVWYRDGLSNYVQQMLLDSRTLSRPYLERRHVEAVVRAHTRGERNYTKEIHLLLSLELLHRLFFDTHDS